MRNPVFDIMKGISVLLMIVGHLLFLPSWIVAAIYSFHMPLFFLLAGYFLKPAGGLRKDFVRLVVPYLFIMLVMIFWNFLQSYAKGDSQIVIGRIKSFIWSTPDAFYDTNYIGSVWFLLALFWGKELLRFILATVLKKRILCVCGLLSIIAVFVHRIVRISPWCILQGLNAMIFLGIGWFCKGHVVPEKIKIGSVVVWVGMMTVYIWKKNWLDMSVCNWVLWPLDVISACGGTYCIYLLAKGILGLRKTRIHFHFLEWCGRYSMSIVCMHFFVDFSSLSYSLVILAQARFLIGTYWMDLFRILLTLFLAWLCIKLPVLRKIFT